MSYEALSKSVIIQKKAFNHAIVMLKLLGASSYDQKSSKEQAEIDVWYQNAVDAQRRMREIYESMDMWLLKKLANANLAPVHESDDDRLRRCPRTDRNIVQLAFAG